MPIRVCVVQAETDTAEEAEALGRAVQGFIRTVSSSAPVAPTPLALPEAEVVGLPAPEVLPAAEPELQIPEGNALTCPRCDFVAKSAQGFGKHVRHCGAAKSSTRPSAKPAAPTRRPPQPGPTRVRVTGDFGCPICQRPFETAYALAVHSSKAHGQRGTRHRPPSARVSRVPTLSPLAGSSGDEDESASEDDE